MYGGDFCNLKRKQNGTVINGNGAEREWVCDNERSENGPRDYPCALLMIMNAHESWDTSAIIDFGHSITFQLLFVSSDCRLDNLEKYVELQYLGYLIKISGNPSNQMFRCWFECDHLASHQPTMENTKSDVTCDLIYSLNMKTESTAKTVGFSLLCVIIIVCIIVAHKSQSNEMPWNWWWPKLSIKMMSYFPKGETDTD